MEIIALIIVSVGERSSSVCDAAVLMYTSFLDLALDLITDAARKGYNVVRPHEFVVQLALISTFVLANCSFVYTHDFAKDLNGIGQAPRLDGDAFAAEF